MKFINHEDCVECQFDKTPHIRFWVSHELASKLGGTAEIEKLVASRQMMISTMWPRWSSKARPWALLDYELRSRNVAMGKRHWQYKDNCIVGNTRYYGYGHPTDHGFQFYKWNPERPYGEPISGRISY